MNSEFVAHGDIFFLVFDWYSFLVLIFTRGLKVTILSVEIKCGSVKCSASSIEKGGSKRKKPFEYIGKEKVLCRY